MRKILFAAFAAATLAALSTSPADASGGCGPYRHRTPMGFCRPPGQWGWGPGGYYGHPGWYGPGWRWRRWHRWGYY